MSWVKRMLPQAKVERDNLLKGFVAGTLAVLIILALTRLAGC